jgi:DNA-binding IclR family transcriptional regulator
MTVLAMEEGPRHFQVSSRVGSRIPLNWTASGRLLVGFLPFEERLAFFRESAVASPTGRAITDPEILAEASGDAFERGVSVQLSESDFAVACVAAPIHEANGACLATMSLVLPEQRVIEAREFLIEAVRAAARRVENALGPPPPQRALPPHP